MPNTNSSLLDTTAFTNVLAQATRKAGFRVERTEELALFVDMQDTSLRCNLATVYNAYRQSPDRLDDMLSVYSIDLSAQKVGEKAIEKICDMWQYTS